jgi:hypothetical protein
VGKASLCRIERIDQASRQPVSCATFARLRR